MTSSTFEWSTIPPSFATVLSTSSDRARIHYRTLMEDVGLPLDEVASLEIAFSALADVAHACKLLCQAGYNHRDLSCRNIVVEEDNGEGRLGDLEFVRSHEDGSIEHDIPKRTREFMALEALDQRYCFGQEGADVPMGDLPVRHNAGHDLESILWIAVFMLYNSLVFDIGDGLASEEFLKRLTDTHVHERARILDYRQRSMIFGSPGLASLLKRHTKSRAAAMTYKQLDIMELALKLKYKQFDANLSDADHGESRNHEFLPVHHIFERTLRTMSGLFKGKIFIYIGTGKWTPSD